LSIALTKYLINFLMSVEFDSVDKQWHNATTASKYPSTMHDTTPFESTPTARAQRLKQARKLARLTLRGMSEGSPINFNTLCGWESARHGGLTKAGAQKVVERLAQEDLVCSVDWLLFGTGNPPSKAHASIRSAYPSPLPQKEISLEDFIPTQIRWMEQQFPHFIGCVIQDRAMEPLYGYGDYVTGQPIPLEEMPFSVGDLVIAQLENGKRYCRYLGFCETTRSYTLIPARLAGPDGSIITAPIVACARVMAHFRYHHTPSF
jgi:transcriptional regulator with XRE-family HTH domain